MSTRQHNFGTVVIGSGPAGSGLLFNAIRKNKVDEFLNSGVAFVDLSGDFACGTIGKYVINSDTAGGVFLECLSSMRAADFANTRLQKMIALITRYHSRPVPLEWVGDFMKLLGSELKTLLQNHPSSRFFSHTRVESVTKQPGGFITRIVRVENGEESIELLLSDTVVFAMGGRQDWPQVLDQKVAGQIDLKEYAHKLMLTDQMFTRQGIKNARELLLRAKNQKVVVLGGSHSAFSSLSILFSKMKEFKFEESDIVLAHRNKLKLFYPSREEALTDGYSDFDENDICPLTKKVYRLAGLRLDSRQILREILGLAPGKEKRVKLLPVSDAGQNINELRHKLDEAALVVSAFGYKARTVPVLDEQGGYIHLAGDFGGTLVNKYCEVIDSDNQAVDGLFGIGLASGFVPWGHLGGEPGFSGQTNGLWLYQNGVGEVILDRLLEKQKNKQLSSCA